MSDTIADFVRERNEALLSGDVDRVIAFHAKHNPGAPTPNRDVMEAGMHKARTAALALLIEERKASKLWLQERGLQHFGDDL